jgi:hypothetical protein
MCLDLIYEMAVFSPRWFIKSQSSLGLYFRALARGQRPITYKCETYELQVLRGMVYHNFPPLRCHKLARLMDKAFMAASVIDPPVTLHFYHMLISDFTLVSEIIFSSSITLLRKRTADKSRARIILAMKACISTRYNITGVGDGRVGMRDAAADRMRGASMDGAAVSLSLGRRKGVISRVEVDSLLSFYQLCMTGGDALY